MKIKTLLIIACIFSWGSKLTAQDLSVAGYYYASKNGGWLQLEELLAGTQYLGYPERIEIELMGGNYSAFNKITYFIEARGSIEVTKIVENGDVPGHELKIYDTGAAADAPDRYIVGISIPSGQWYSIAVRAKELSARKWLSITNTPEPSLPLADVSVNDKSHVAQNIDGNVGIGTLNPTAKLAVSGKVKAKEVIVTEQSSDWPDYVFKEEYKLPDLTEIEAYIQKHEHLPGVPAKEEIAQVGQNLGTIQVKLLEKIEQLTLYVIELKKESRQQKKQIERLKASYLSRIQLLEAKTEN